jgi:hypothetical protein
MKISSIVLGRRDFYSKEEIIDFARNSKNYNPEEENIHDAEALMIFQTSNQQTWMVSTNQRLYCILDDIRNDEPNINWSLAKERLSDGEQVTIAIKSRDKSEKTGLVDIGPEHKNWLFSKQLFKEQNVDKSIRQLIKNKML